MWGDLINILKIRIDKLDDGGDRGLGNGKIRNALLIFMLSKCDALTESGKTVCTYSLGVQESLIMFCVHINTQML